MHIKKLTQAQCQKYQTPDEYNSDLKLVNVAPFEQQQKTCKGGGYQKHQCHRLVTMTYLGLTGQISQ